LIVVGDFNATPFSSIYKNFVGNLNLKNAMQGYGMPKTWDAQSILKRVTIDHVLFKELNVKKFDVLGEIFSDHYPLLVEFEF